ncbi:S-adenosyl-L-methionine-dependent methyltransferase [Rhexocercosporidium sp. MPI-PUGE-AT-0058]|nr:S-adenosyl-L-methionine-dependent methyltransferase [Rhexocercosporidium sp. MPI-PUGE-AT-0058]
MDLTPDTSVSEVEIIEPHVASKQVSRSLKESEVQIIDPLTTIPNKVDVRPEKRSKLNALNTSEARRPVQPHQQAPPQFVPTTYEVDGFEELKYGPGGIINVDDLEERFEAEFYGVTSQAQARAQPIPARNLSIRFPQVELDTYSVHGIKLKKGKTVEFLNGDFLKIGKIVKNSQTGEVVVRGWPLKRCSQMRGLLPKKLNELCFVLEVELDDPRPTLEQSMVQVGLEGLVKIRHLISTNYPHPHLGFPRTGLPYESKDDNLEYVKDYERLVVRWKFITFYDNATEHARTPIYPTNIHKKILAGLNEEDCTPGCYMDPAALRHKWRGETVIGGSGSAEIPRLTQTLNHQASEDPYTYGDAFCGAGGTTRGAAAAALKVLWGLDLDKNAGMTWRANFSTATHYEMWAHDLVAMINASTDLLVDILHLSPPCQVFSPVHTRVGKNDQQNFDSLFACDALVHKARPRIITLEQTFGILHPKFEAAFNSLIQTFTSYGYSVSYQIVQFQNYGLAQTRRRLIIVAACPGETLPEVPAYTHSKSTGGGLKPLTSVRSVLNQVPSNCPNHNVQAAYRRGGLRPTWDASGVIPTITCDGGDRGHPDGERGFTERELAALQSFPHNHVFYGNSIKKQIGNAVPPLIAEILFKAIIKHLRMVDRVEQMKQAEGIE